MICEMKEWTITISEVIEAETKEEAMAIFNEQLRERIIEAILVDVEEYKEEDIW